MARTISISGLRGPIVICMLVGIGSLATLRAAAIPDEPVVTSRISSSAQGAQADGESTGPALSTDGRYVAFVSWATNLIPGDTNNLADVFVKDREAGTLVRASLSASGAPAAGGSWAPSLSGDGRYAAFVSDAWNIVASDSNEAADVFVRDLVQNTTVRASVSSAGIAANGPSTNSALSADGRFVAFESHATNLVAGDGNGECDVFVRDLVAGTTERISVGSGGIEALGSTQAPAISADGRYVAFASAASNIVWSPADTNQVWDVFLRDRVAATTVRVSVSSSGIQGNGASFASSVSSDGRYVAFESQASDLVAGDGNARSDVFVRDLQSGTTTRVSVGAGGLQGNAGSVRPSLSGDGRWIAFPSEASNLVAVDDNGEQDVFLHDRVASTTIRVSVATSGAPAHGGSSWPALSRDGRFVAFPCAAADLVAGDTNGELDVFVRGPLH